VLTGTEKIVLHGISPNTTHHEMELTAVIKALEYVAVQYPTATLQIFSDSQYVTGLPARKEKLLSAGFSVKKGNPVQHAELVKTLFRLLEQLSITLVKIPSHQKNSGAINYNTEADILSRKLVREAIKKHSHK
jgi:ribonuclease HI